MRPEGIGRFGSLMASTCRSYQSFTAWLVPHTIGPASSTPATISGQRCPGEMPDETMPHPNAHIGGNQVIGFNSSRTTRGDGRSATALFILALLVSSMFGEAEPAQFDIKALPAETEHFCRRRPIVPGQFQCCFDRQFFDHVGGLAYEIAQRNPADQLG